MAHSHDAFFRNNLNKPQLFRFTLIFTWHWRPNSETLEVEGVIHQLKNIVNYFSAAAYRELSHQIPSFVLTTLLTVFSDLNDFAHCNAERRLLNTYIFSLAYGNASTETEHHTLRLEKSRF